ncbi:MAG: ATP synthase F1 subunit delta [Ignavibacteria bacterium]
MSNLNIANRYATVLMKLTEERNSFDTVSDDIELIKKTLGNSKELLVVLHSPVIPSKTKYSILTELFESKVSRDSLEFVQFIVDKNREELLLNIVRRYLELRDQHLGLINADIYSVLELEEEQKIKLKSRLEELTQKKVRLSYFIDTKIIGGFIIKIEDTIYDASLRRQLELLEKRLLSGNLILN